MMDVSPVKGKVWTIWKYTIGSFSDEKTAEHDDIVAILRTLIVLVNFMTCFFIMANVVHNWQKNEFIAGKRIL